MVAPEHHYVLQLAVAGALVVLASGCGSDAAAPPSTTTTSSTTVITGPTAHDAAELARALGCPSSERADVDIDPDEPVRPASARQCVIGEAHFTIAVYDTAAHREQVLRWLDQFSGYRAVGPNWIVAVDTPESAHVAADRLHGTFVELRGTAHG